jgi:hypothetical protein
MREPQILHRNSEAYRLAVIKGYEIHTRLGSNIVTIQKQLTGTASLINKMSGNSAFAMDSTHCINKYDVDHINIEVPNSLQTQNTC